jgi:hypothetical protein
METDNKTELIFCSKKNFFPISVHALPVPLAHDGVVAPPEADVVPVFILPIYQVCLFGSEIYGKFFENGDSFINVSSIY